MIPGGARFGYQVFRTRSGFEPDRADTKFSGNPRNIGCALLIACLKVANQGLSLDTGGPCKLGLCDALGPSRGFESFGKCHSSILMFREIRKLLTFENSILIIHS